MSFSLSDLAQRIGAVVRGDGSMHVTGCAPIDRAGAEDVTFIANAKYRKYLQSTQAAAVIVDEATDCPPGLTTLVADDPYFAFRNAIVILHGFRQHPEPMRGGGGGGGVSDLACVHETASIGDRAVVHPFAVVEKGAKVGPDTVLYPGSYVGPNASIGEACLIYPNAVVYERCIVGNRVIIHANSVVGQDGFGYATHAGEHHKIPQTGIVVIEDDVELGAACAIERAAMGETRIGKGTKFADLISIGHGTTVGRHCLFVSLVGVSGSVEVGNYVVLGGQVGVIGHLSIGDGVQAAGRTGIVHDVPPGQAVGGAPAVDLKQAKRNALAGMDLYGLTKRVKQLEKQIEELQRE